MNDIRNARSLALVACLALANTGCNLSNWAHNGFKVGPDYFRPMAPVSSQWIDYQDPRIQMQEVSLSQWWQVFNDPVLNSLVDTAYQQNLTLREAGAGILRARAIRRNNAGSLFPQIQEAFGDYTASKTSMSTAVQERFGQQGFGTGGLFPDYFENWRTGLNLTWELDLWGLYRRMIEAADAELDASIENYDAFLVLRLAEVATSYIQYRTFQERLGFASENARIQETSYELAMTKYKAGATSERDVQQAAQSLAATKARIPELETGVRGANNAICVLLGMPPQDLAQQLGSAAKIPRAPREIAVGIPADLLRRRPDVRMAERLVAAQSAKIGIAETDLYPRLMVNGGLGFEAAHFGNLFETPKSMTGSIGPSFQWKILNYGRILSNIEEQEARFQELAFKYQQKVLDANREAEDAIVAFMKSQEQTGHLEDSVKAAQRTLDITNEQYRAGIVDFTPVFLFQAALTQAQDQLAISQGNMALSLVVLYRTLGGGWEMRLAAEEGIANMNPLTPGAVPTPAEAVPAIPPAVRTDETTP